MSAYEFDANENKVIQRFANWMLFLGIISLLWFASEIVPAIQGLASGISLDSLLPLLLLVAVIFFALAFILPYDNLRRIVKTEGSDIEELMSAMEELKKYLGLAISATIFYAVMQILTLF